jgi:hypothetical protein
MSDPTSPMQHETEPKSFAPKTPVDLAAPKDDPITYEELAQCDGASTPLQRTQPVLAGTVVNKGLTWGMILGSDPSKPTLVAIKGTVFDVSRNEAYAPKGTYHGTAPPPSHPSSAGFLSAQAIMLTAILHGSIRRQGPLTCACDVVAQSRRLCAGVERPERRE